MIRRKPVAHIIVLTALAMLVSACGGGGNGGSKSAPGSNASLAALVLEQVTLIPAFASGTVDYSAEVPNGVLSTRVTPTATDSAAVVRVNDEVVASGAMSAAIALAEGANTITIVVTARDGTTTRTYTVAVNRRPPPSTNADLASLALTVALLDQIFDPTSLSYTATAGYLGTSTRVIAIPDDASASVTLNGIALPHGAPSEPILLTTTTGNNALTLMVTAEDAVTTRSYSVDIARGPLTAVGQEAYVKAANADSGDWFGASIALSGETLVVGAPREDSNALGINGNDTNNFSAEAGAAYLFERTGNTWVQVAYVKASNTDAFDHFGGALALDGDLLAVGALDEDSSATGINGNEANDAASAAGAAYVFERDAAGDWRKRAYVKASNTEAADRFGRAISLGTDLILIGAPGEDSNATGIDQSQTDNSFSGAGAAYLFGRNSTGAWSQLAYLKATNTGSLDEFGRSVAISSTAFPAVAAVGAWREDSNAKGIRGDQSDNSLRDAGAVYLYQADELTGGWSGGSPVYVKASNPSAFDGFGASVALDGNLLAVGAPGQDSNAAGINGNELNQSMQGAGAVYLLERNADGRWAQIAYVKASHPSAFDEFGATVALHGNLLAVGAPGQNSAGSGINDNEVDQSRLNAGAVYLFERNAAGRWAQIAYVKASNPDAGDEFGGTVGLDDPDNLFGGAIGFYGNTLAVGAALEDSNSVEINGNETNNSASAAGAVYLVR